MLGVKSGKIRVPFFSEIPKARISNSLLVGGIYATISKKCLPAQFRETGKFFHRMYVILLLLVSKAVSSVPKSSTMRRSRYNT